ncbi:MAG TPA: hypothetical protein VNU64_00775, partial [Burkholderiales bacterium]|nr:hypothetical protein [Burkholderiales bacterium]
MGNTTLAQRILVSAATEVGGTELLARYLKVEILILERWMAGGEVPPADMVLRAAEVVMDWRGPLNS